LTASEPTEQAVGSLATPAPSFDTIYEQEFEFVWRNLRRLAVPEASLRDVAQDVFLVIHRRLPEFEGRAPLRSWIYSILTRVVRQHRRSARRRDVSSAQEPDEVADAGAPSPHSRAEQSEHLALLVQLLADLDDEQRSVFVLSELEGMTAPEVAAALDVKLNTVYSRLRLARQHLREQLAALHQRERERP